MRELISNVKIYGIEDSIIASKYPFAVNVEEVNSTITKGIDSLGMAEKGSGHDNFLNGIIVQFDLTCPIKMWTEMQRYHFIDFVSSQSTIHCITKFNVREQYDEHVHPAIVDVMELMVDEYNTHVLQKDYPRDKLKEEYIKILMSNPCGFNLTARMTTNYRQLKTIYAQRKYHKLPQWREFCDWCETLPNANWIVSGGNK